MTELEKIAERIREASRPLFGNGLERYLDHWLALFQIKPLPYAKDEANPTMDEFVPSIAQIVLESCEIFHREAMGPDGKLQDCYDVLGHVFEASNGKFDRSWFGQFFTPLSVCRMMSKMTIQDTYVPKPKGRVYTVSDPACGSGRTLIDAHMQLLECHPDEDDAHTRFFYSAVDKDHMCSKMCLINFMLHGMSGEVLCMDTLSMQYRFGWHVEHVPIRNWLKSKGDLNRIMYATYMYENIRFEDSDGRLVISPAGDDHFHAIKDITLEESIQYQSLLEPKQEAAPDVVVGENGQLAMF